MYIYKIDKTWKNLFQFLITTTASKYFFFLFLFSRTLDKCSKLH